MEFPSDNKYHIDQDLIESNAKALEEIATKVNYKLLFKAYWFVVLNIALGIGVIVAIINLAMKI